MKSITLSRSDLELAARCKRKFYYKQVLKLDSGVSGGAASEGTLIHAGLAAAFSQAACLQGAPNAAKGAALEAMAAMAAKGTSPYRGVEQPLSPSALETETITRLGDVVQFYIDNQMPLDLKNAEVVAVEAIYTYPLTVFAGTQIYLEGQIDLILKRWLDETSFIYEVYDHKTKDSMPQAGSMDFLRLDVQFLTYEWLVSNTLHTEEGCRGVEMVCNLIKRDVPPGYGHRELKINLNGSVSKKNASMEVSDYLKQIRQSHTQQELKYVALELIRLADDYMGMLFPSRPINYTRNVIKSGGEQCTNCNFFNKCSAELLGHTDLKLVSSEA